MNLDAGFCRHPSEQPIQVGRTQGNAARRGGATCPRQMQEHRAPPPRNPRAGVVVDLDDEVVQMVVAPKPVAWVIGRPSVGPVVATVARQLAPGEVWLDPPNRKRGARPRRAIRTPPEADEMEPAARGRAVALALVSSNPGAAENDRDGTVPSKQNATRTRTGPGAHADQPQSQLQHGSWRSSRTRRINPPWPLAEASIILIMHVLFPQTQVLTPTGRTRAKPHLM